jgi:phage repressor protein C with HTH and peptisase S24 domain
MFLLTLSDKFPIVPRDGVFLWELSPLFTHPQVWDGIDKLAKEKGWSPSRLAREAGLDPTTFNKSKRHTNQEKPRWPSTESLAKILEATNTPLEYFVGLMSDHALNPKMDLSGRIRCLSFDDAADNSHFDESGFPVEAHWDEINFPGLSDQHAFALEVRGNDLLPAYRDGDLLIISPSSNVRRQDRVVLKVKEGTLEVGTLSRRTAQRLELDRFNDAAGRVSLNVRDVVWLSRIVWASQ